jgi:hypothetical protein
MKTNFNNAALSDIELDAVSGSGDDKVTVEDVKKMFAERGDPRSKVVTPEAIKAATAGLKPMT